PPDTVGILETGDRLLAWVAVCLGGRHGVASRVTHGHIQTAARQRHVVFVCQTHAPDALVIPVLLPVTVVIKDTGRHKRTSPDPGDRWQGPCGFHLCSGHHPAINRPGTHIIGTYRRRTAQQELTGTVQVAAGFLTGQTYGSLQRPVNLLVMLQLVVEREEAAVG